MYVCSKNGINFKHRKDLDKMVEKSIESTHAEITAKSRKKIIIGSLYHPPNTASHPFTDYVS